MLTLPPRAKSRQAAQTKGQLVWEDIASGYLSRGLENAPAKIAAWSESLSASIKEGQEIAAEAEVANPIEREALMARYREIASDIDMYFYVIGA